MTGRPWLQWITDGAEPAARPSDRSGSQRDGTVSRAWLPGGATRPTPIATTTRTGPMMVNLKPPKWITDPNRAWTKSALAGVVSTRSPPCLVYLQTDEPTALRQQRRAPQPKGPRWPHQPGVRKLLVN